MKILISLEIFEIITYIKILKNHHTVPFLYNSFGLSLDRSGGDKLFPTPSVPPGVHLPRHCCSLQQQAPEIPPQGDPQERHRAVSNSDLTVHQKRGVVRTDVLHHWIKGLGAAK